MQETDGFIYYATEHFRMSGVYWGLSALRLLGKQQLLNEKEILEWVLACKHDTGGFSGSPRQDPHALYTLSAVQILAMYDRLDLVEKETTAKCKPCGYPAHAIAPVGCRWLLPRTCCDD